jgi:succinyl-diaminopimelate desuccinylase
VSLRGERAHTARPSAGRNAIYRLGPLLDTVAGYRGRRPVLDGCEYAEQLQAVEVSGGTAPNVVPDEVSVLLNHRFAPDRSVEEAEASVRELVASHLEPGDQWELVEFAAGARPALDHVLLSALVASSGAPARAKLGWTDVASLWSHEIPATNFGPGDPMLAHTPGEHVSARELEAAALTLEQLLRRP